MTSIPSLNSRSLRPAATLALFAALGSAAHAETYCAGTASSLRDAISQASSATGNVDIRIRTGVYATAGQQFSFEYLNGKASQITGGWNVGCSARSNDPGQTVLDGGQGSSVLFVTGESGITSASMFLSNFTVANGNTQSGSAGCLTVNSGSGSPTVIVDRVVARGCDNGFGTGGGLRLDAAGSGSSIQLRNSLITDSIGTQNGGGGVGVSSGLNANVFITNNTIAFNFSRQNGSPAGLSRAPGVDQLGNVFVRNNAIFSNTDFGGTLRDIGFPSGNPSLNRLDNNGYGVIQGSGHTAVASVVTTNPGFLSPTRFALRVDSPLRNAGLGLSVVLTGPQDLDFAPRVREGAIDIGALEYEGLLVDGFE